MEAKGLETRSMSLKTIMMSTKTPTSKSLISLVPGWCPTNNYSDDDGHVEENGTIVGIQQMTMQLDQITTWEQAERGAGICTETARSSPTRKGCYQHRQGACCHAFFTWNAPDGLFKPHWYRT